MNQHSLIEYRGRPHTTATDFGDITVTEIVKSYTTYKSSLEVDEAVPEHCAIQFYMANTAKTMLSQATDNHQPLNDDQMWLMDNYYESMEDIGIRCFFYVLLICTRETRHVSDNVKMLAACEPTGAIPFWKTLKGVGSDTAVGRLLTNPPNISLKAYTQHMVDCFQLGGHGGSYAGPKWAAVARPLRDYVHGQITLEMFTDVVWTLAHNGGPIFNKGMLFKHYNSTELMKILDVQRAGQIPNLVAHGESVFVTKQHFKFLTETRKVLPEFGMGPVDWQTVVNLGAVGHYGIKKKPGSAIPPHHAPGATATPTAPKVKPPMDPNLFEIFPKVYVKKVSRKEIKS